MTKVNDKINNNKLINAVNKGKLDTLLLLTYKYPKEYNTAESISKLINEVISRRNEEQYDDGEFYYIDYDKAITLLLIILFKYHYNKIYESSSKEKDLLIQSYNEIINNKDDFEEETISLFELLISDKKVNFNSLILSLLDHINRENAFIILGLIYQIWCEDFRMKCSISGREFTSLDLLECENRHFTVNGILLNEKEKIEYAKKECINLCWIDSASLEDLQKSKILSAKLKNTVVLENVVKLTTELCLIHNNFIPFVYQTYESIIKDLY